MIRSTVARYGFPLAVVSLVAGILLVGGFLIIVAVPDLSRPVTAGPASTPGATPAPSASGLSPMADSPIGIPMSADADCGACHVTTNGTVGTRDIPVMAHPLWGWRDCTACHTTGSLVATAPGHSGLHKDECLVCHKAPDAETASPAPMRPEHMGLTQPCTSCHGLDKHAPLPDDMKGRNNCWICHNGPEFTYLWEEPTPSATAPSVGAAPPAGQGG
jgi:hypothetical protein